MRYDTSQQVITDSNGFHHGTRPIKKSVLNRIQVTRKFIHACQKQKVGGSYVHCLVTISNQGDVKCQQCFLVWRHLHSHRQPMLHVVLVGSILPHRIQHLFMLASCCLPCKPGNDWKPLVTVGNGWERLETAGRVHNLERFLTHYNTLICACGLLGKHIRTLDIDVF